MTAIKAGFTGRIETINQTVKTRWMNPERDRRCKLRGEMIFFPRNKTEGTHVVLRSLEDRQFVRQAGLLRSTCDFSPVIVRVPNCKDQTVHPYIIIHRIVHDIIALVLDHAGRTN